MERDKKWWKMSRYSDIMYNIYFGFFQKTGEDPKIKYFLIREKAMFIVWLE